MITLNINDLIQTLILIWPAYVSNGTPPITSKLFRKRTPIDFGKYFIDGKRIFGDGKTIEGFVIGVLAGFLITLLTYYIIYTVYPNVKNIFYFPKLEEILFINITALLGDLLGAFIKRRLGLPRGYPAPILDQLDFLIFPLTYMYVSGIIDTVHILYAVVLTIPIHLLTNFIGYKLGVKKEPW